MPSKMVTDRQKRTIQILAAGQEHRDRIIQKLEERLRPHLAEGEPMPDVGKLLDLLYAMVATALGGMLKADEAHIRELGDDEEPRDRRDAATDTLYVSLSDLREILTGLHGAGILGSLHLATLPIKDAAVVAGVGREVATALRETTLPPPRIKDAKLDAESWAARIDKERTAIDEAMADVARESREAETTLGAKNAAIDLHDADERAYSAIVSGLLDLIGETAKADRVRPAERRPHRARGGKDGGEGGGGEGGGDGNGG